MSKLLSPKLAALCARLSLMVLFITTGWIVATSGSIASAARPATPKETSAIAEEVGFPDGCVTAQVSSARPSWAVAESVNADDCPTADGVVLLEGADASWTQITAGSDFGYCPIDGVPTAVSAEFELCRNASPADTVLGGFDFAPNGDGFGERRPRRVYNGGVPSGLAEKIRWSGWGSSVAKGRGKTYLYKPQGGYYARKGAIEFRAYQRGRCQPGGPPAYRRLKARVAKRPGGPMGRWFLWSGAKSICAL